METFPIISASELFHEISSIERCGELLAGVPFNALVRYAAGMCHNLTRANEIGADLGKIIEFHRWFLEHRAPQQFSAHVLDLLSHRRAYHGKAWALADPNRVASLVVAYARANSNPVEGNAKPAHFERLLRAQFVVNDLVSLPGEGTSRSTPMTDVLRICAMSRGWQALHTMPRAFELLACRLPSHLPGVLSEIRDHVGLELETVGIVLFVLYLTLIHDVPGLHDARHEERRRWSTGLLDLASLGSDDRGEVVIRNVLGRYACTWREFHDAACAMSPTEPSMKQLFRWPLIRTSEEAAWCFDPGLLLNAAANGLIFLAADAHGAANHDRQDVFRAQGQAFEDYLSDLIDIAGRPDKGRGSAEGQGLPDFYMLEEDTLIAIEAKAGLMRDEVKWAADSTQLKEELRKVAKGNQLMNAIGTLLGQSSELRSRARRVVPLYVVLDPIFACPGLEAELVATANKPAIACEIDDPHLIYVGEFEEAGDYIRERRLAKLLGVRRAVAGGGWLTLGELISRYKSRIQAALGDWYSGFDAHVDSRRLLNDAMDRFRDEYGGGVDTKERSDPRA